MYVKKNKIGFKVELCLYIYQEHFNLRVFKFKMVYEQSKNCISWDLSFQTPFLTFEELKSKTTIKINYDGALRVWLSYSAWIHQHNKSN